MASYDAFIKQLTNPRYLRRDLRVADIKGPRVPKVGVPRVGFMAGSPNPDETNKIKKYLISRKKDFLNEKSLVDLGKELGYEFTKGKNNTYRNTDFEWKVNKIVNENPELYKLTEQDKNRAYNKRFKEELKIANYDDWGKLNIEQKRAIYNISAGLKSGRDPKIGRAHV